ncbi:MAG: hypothetical protein EOM23_03365 [Candidatus Moranbacteria bacterium]|nr:hypothetical protein [Candidatus Moranbacteria bacterium]
MTTETKIRNEIFGRIEGLPEEQLTKLDMYLKKLALEKTKKDRILSYAGAWKDMDDEIFREFTTELSTRRTSKTEFI